MIAGLTLRVSAGELRLKNARRRGNVSRRSGSDLQKQQGASLCKRGWRWGSLLGSGSRAPLSSAAARPEARPTRVAWATAEAAPGARARAAPEAKDRGPADRGR